MGVVPPTLPGERQRTPPPPLAASEASRHFRGFSVLIMIKNQI